MSEDGGRLREGKKRKREKSIKGEEEEGSKITTGVVLISFTLSLTLTLHLYTPTVCTCG